MLSELVRLDVETKIRCAAPQLRAVAMLHTKMGGAVQRHAKDHVLHCKERTEGWSSAHGARCPHSQSAGRPQTHRPAHRGVGGCVGGGWGAGGTALRIGEQLRSDQRSSPATADATFYSLTESATASHTLRKICAACKIREGSLCGTFPFSTAPRGLASTRAPEFLQSPSLTLLLGR